MKIEIQRLNNGFHLEARNETGNTLSFDGAPDIGGQNLGFRPMQSVLAALGSCSSIDVISILQKQRLEISDYHVSIEAEREKDKTPSLFTTIHLHFTLKGKNLEAGKVQRAIELSVEKYCSVAKILEKTATITHSFTIENE